MSVPYKPTLINDNYANHKKYNIPRAQLILSDLPYCLGNNAYASNPTWYEGGDNSNGESEKAGKTFFRTEEIFKIPEFFWFCSKLLKPEPKEKLGRKEKSQSPCMILFCAFEQQWELINEAKKYGFNHYINLVFRKDFSAQVIKANMKVVGNCEYGLIFYRERLPKFNNNGKMVFNCFDWVRDNDTPKVHPTQKPVGLLENIIQIFTDVGDVVIDPCAGSGTTLLASANLGRKAYGFEVDKGFYKDAVEKVLPCAQTDMFIDAEIEQKRYRQADLFGDVK